jgi:thioredoxin 1
LLPVFSPLVFSFSHFFSVFPFSCRVIGPVLEKMSDLPENSNVMFVKADIDELPEASAEAGIQSVPTFHFVKDGKLVAVVVGADQQRIKENITKHK